MFVHHNGQLLNCRWQADKYNPKFDPETNIKNIEPITFFQKGMTSFRKDILDGRVMEECSECYKVDRYDKISGRQRQLLKSGITLDQFEKTTLSSPMLEYIKLDGSTDLKPIDWQIDLGNYCNGACVYCSPSFSSTLASEYKKIGFIDEMPPRPWSEDQTILGNFVDQLSGIERLSYIHFLGGETLITPAFKQMLEAMVKSGVSDNVSIGFTTNLTVWRDDVAELLTKFQSVNLGMSIECFDPVNDYVRYPSKLEVVEENVNRWLELANKHDWLIQFRITPTLLTLSKLLTVYEFAIDRKISVESCNFLMEPEILRPTVLPREYRQDIITKFEKWIEDNDIESQKIVNTRNPSTIRAQIVQDAKSYVKYLSEAPYETELLPETVKFLKTLETNRNNSILDYLPEYEELFRTAGY